MQVRLTELQTVKGTCMTPSKCNDQFGYIKDDLCSGMLIHIMRCVTC